jgi:hypothetical protein
MLGLGWSLGYEDLEEGKRSLRKLSDLDFQVACFGHGKPILKDASLRFRKIWADVGASRPSKRSSVGNVAKG